MAASRRGGVSLEDICTEFCVSHRTAQRMTEALDGAFANVTTARSPSAKRSVYLIGTYWADSNGRHNTLKLDVAMSNGKRRSARPGRAPLHSPGRPPEAGRDEQSRFWRAIAAGLSSEDAVLVAGVSQPVGTRWFRKAGGMPPAMFRSSTKPLSGRYLSLVEREEIALLRVQGHSM